MTMSHKTSTRLLGKTVLFRADFSHGVAKETGEAIAALTDEGARVAVISGFGTPGGDINPALSLGRFREPLEAVTGTTVTFVPASVGPVAEAGIHAVPFGQVALLENLRFHPDIKRDCRNFAIRLSVLGDYFVTSGELPRRPIGWLTELAAILPTPDEAVPVLLRKES